MVTSEQQAGNGSCKHVLTRIILWWQLLMVTREQPRAEELYPWVVCLWQRCFRPCKQQAAGVHSGPAFSVQRRVARA
jgi:hypothetical protein